MNKIKKMDFYPNFQEASASQNEGRGILSSWFFGFESQALVSALTTGFSRWRVSSVTFETNFNLEYSVFCFFESSHYLASYEFILNIYNFPATTSLGISL